MLPTKLASSDVRGWAKKKMKQGAKSAVKAAKGKPFGASSGQSPPPGKAKAPVDDPTKTQQPAPGKPPAPQPGQQAKVQSPTGQEGKPNTEPMDPMNGGGPGVPEEFLDDMLDPTADPDEQGLPGVDPEIEEKLGDFADVLEHRADELEELAGEVQGDLTGDDVDVETRREVQALIPDDMRQELVEHLSALSDDEIHEFCEYLQEQGRIENADLMASFLSAASDNSTDDEDDDEDDDSSDDEENDKDDEDDEDGGAAKGKGKLPFGAKKPKKKGKSSDDDDDDGESETDSDDDE